MKPSGYILGFDSLLSLMIIRMLTNVPFTLSLSWYVQYTRNAELITADNRKPTTYAEYVVCTLHEKHDAIVKPESRSCSTGKLHLI